MKKPRFAFEEELLAPVEAFEELYPSFCHPIESQPSWNSLVWPDLTAAYAAAVMPPQQYARHESDDGSSVDVAAPVFVASSAAATAAAVATSASSSSCEDGGSVEASRHLQQLRDNESRWRKTVQQLYERYAPGTALPEVQRVEERLRCELKDINAILESSVLRVEDVLSALSLRGRYENDLNECAVLESEELFHAGPAEAAPEPSDLAVLEWEEQPLSRSYKNKNRARASKKKKKGHALLRARLVLAPGVKFSPSSSVTAQLYAVEEIESPPRRGPGGKKRAAATATAVEHSEEPMEIQLQNNEEKLVRGEAEFDLRFPAGTRNKPVNVRVRVRGTMTLPDGSKRQLELVSRPTHRLIVTTNECQYEAAELKLLCMDVFAPGRTTCSWAAFANALQVRWARVTRQETADSAAPSSTSCERRLSASELASVQRHFRDAPRTVRREEVAAFYAYFGKASHHFRHNAAFCQLLMDGLVWGIFLAKGEAEARLRDQPVGTFLLRSSETAPGAFCVSWRAPNAVRHALLDVKLLAPPLSNLVLHLGSKPFLKYVLRFEGALPLESKEAAFAAYYPVDDQSSAATPKPDRGYEDLDAL